MARLLILDGPGKGSTYELREMTKLGRSIYCDVRLAGKGISRIHASIRKEGDSYIVRDEMSLNGVFVNGKKSPEKVLARGDRLGLGDVTLIFEPEFDIKVSDESGDSVLITTTDGDAMTHRITRFLDLTATEIHDDRYTRQEKELLIAHNRLKTLYEVSSIISCILDEQELLGKVIDLVLSAFQAERGFIMYLDEKVEDLIPAVVRGRDTPKVDIAVSGNILDRVTKEKKGVSGLCEVAGAAAPQSRSMMGAPLVRKDRLLGIVYVDTPSSTRQYTEDDLKLLMSIANQAAAAIDNARLFTRTRQENIQLRERLQPDLSIIAHSNEMKAVLEQVRKVAASDSTILLRGETGTGKEIIAHAIHKASHRTDKPFVPVNCTAIGEPLLESELFGHERGAFTGAYKTKPGKFEVADGGTIFLDEIGEISPSIQLKLLRVLEQKRFSRVGGVRILSVDVRIVAATNRNLEAAVQNAEFREDLYYRLSVIPITLPPLRERRDDIPKLVTHFIKRYSSELGKNIKGVTDEAMSILSEYDWPGNVREVQNLIERCVVLSDRSWIDVDDLPVTLCRQRPLPAPSAAEGGGFSLHDIVRDTEKALIKKALERTNRKKCAAAKLLKISRPTLDKKIREYGA